MRWVAALLLMTLPGMAAEEPFWVGRWQSTQAVPDQTDPCEFHQSSPPLVITDSAYDDCPIIDTFRIADEAVLLWLDCPTPEEWGEEVIVTGNADMIFPRHIKWRGGVHGMGRCR